MRSSWLAAVYRYRHPSANLAAAALHRISQVSTAFRWHFARFQLDKMNPASCKTSRLFKRKQLCARAGAAFFSRVRDFVAASVEVLRWPTVLVSIFMSAQLFADPGIPEENTLELLRSRVVMASGADAEAGSDHELWLRALTLATLQAAAATTPEAVCTEGGTIRPQCRSEGDSAVYVAELRGCRFKFNGTNVLAATGELVLALPENGSCPSEKGSLCGTVTVHKMRTVATVTDQHGRVIGTADFSDLPAPLPIVVPCPTSPIVHSGS